MALFASKPTTVEAIQWIGGSQWSEVQEFGAKIKINRQPGGGVELLLLAGKDGAQGYVSVPVGHWIVRQPGDLSDHWPVEDDYFQSKYEPSLSVEEWRDRLGVERAEPGQ